MPFRTSILAISPPWLVEEGGTAEAVQYAEGLVMDGVAEWMIQSVQTSMPGVGTPDALYLIGRDMQIDRGPYETDDHYAGRLQGAIDSHRVRGSGPELLRQLYSWFSPSTSTPIRLVTNSAVWHEIDLFTEVVTKTVVGTNWTWDAFASTRWFRGWVIIDSTYGPWAIDIWDTTATWGDGGVWGSDATPGDVASIQRIVDRWKPANIYVPAIIISFSITQFERTDTAPPNPNGLGESPAWRIGYSANFWRSLP